MKNFVGVDLKKHPSSNLKFRKLFMIFETCQLRHELDIDAYKKEIYFKKLFRLSEIDGMLSMLKSLYSQLYKRKLML